MSGIRAANNRITQLEQRLQAVEEICAQHALKLDGAAIVMKEIIRHQNHVRERINPLLVEVGQPLLTPPKLLLPDGTLHNFEALSPDAPRVPDTSTGSLS